MNTPNQCGTFWEVVMPYLDRIKAIFVGHIHQEMHKINYGTSGLAAHQPAYSLNPFVKTIPLTKLPGLRWINLYNNGLLATGIKRTDTI